MDFVKDGLGVEVQFGKYSFMVYNVCAKMTIFRNLGFIECGIEIVPVKALALEIPSVQLFFDSDANQPFKIQWWTPQLEIEKDQHRMR